MKRLTIYCKGGTKWVVNTKNEGWLNDIHGTLIDPKNKYPFITIDDKENNIKTTIRKEAIDIYTIEEVSG